MSLEEKIRRFSEQARGYLLEEFAKSTRKDTEVVQWQGYNEDGKLQVRNKDLDPVVDGLGQIYQTKGSDLIFDNKGTVEQRKARRRQAPVELVERIQQIPEGKIFPRTNIIVFEETAEGEELLGTMLLGMYMVYYVDNWYNFYSSFWSNQNNYSLYTQSSADRNVTEFLEPNISAVDEEKVDEIFYIGVASFSVLTGTPLDGTEYGGPSADPGPHTSSASIGAPFNLSGSTTSTTGQAFRRNHGAVQVFGKTTDTDINFECDIVQHSEHQNDYRLAGFFGDSRVRYYLYWFSVKKYIYYLQSNAVNNEDQYVKIDLAKYVDDSIMDFKIRHSYTTNVKVDNYTEHSISFLIFEIHTVDFDQSDSEETITTDSFGDTSRDEKNVWRGEKKSWVLHFKINLTTGTIEHKKQQALNNRTGDNIIEEANSSYVKNGKEYYVYSEAEGANGAASGYISVNSFSTTDVSANYFFANAYEGDWLYKFRNLVIDETDTVSYGYSGWLNVLKFLRMHYYDGSWYGYINGYYLPSTFTNVYIVTWANQTGVGAGEASNNDYTDIQSAVVTLTSFPDETYTYETYFTEERVGAGNLLITKSWYVPDFNYQVDTNRWLPSFSYVQPAKHDIVGINSYSATSTTIFISTALLTSARTNYSVVISGTNLIDGTYLVENIDENSLIVELTNPAANPISPTTETQLSGTLSRT